MGVSRVDRSGRFHLLTLPPPGEDEEELSRPRLSWRTASAQAGNQLRFGSDCTIGPGTWSCSRPTTWPPSILQGRSCTGSRKRELLTSFLIAAFSARFEVP